MKTAKAYYASGVRIVVDGVPLRVARKPGATYSRWIRERDKRADYFTSRERANIRVAEAKRLIHVYAAMLNINFEQAKAKIEAQRLHLLANPLRDLSLEYDL